MAKRWLFLLVVVLAHGMLLPRSAFAADCLSAVDAPGCKHGLPVDQYNVALAIMAANPHPVAHPLTVDPEEIRRYSDTRENPPRWASTFTGILFDAPPALPVVWTLKVARPRILPTWDAPSNTTIPRYTPIYIYATLKSNGLTWYLVGPGQWVERSTVAQFKPASRPGGVGGKWVSIDLTQQVLSVYQNDTLVFATLISSGKGTRPTRTGVFNVYLRQKTGDMSALMGTPDGYNIYDVPWVMYFNNGIALHGATWHNNFGTPMSHGCVNMTITDARWLFGYTEDTPQAQVYVWRSR
ncbi:MAG: L,D-transpeptidase [Anaerolineae bacterium]|nr:L,D-transpeptidase [Anaerolineae bacterium]